MKPELIQHIHDLPVPPVLDADGKWVHCRNARVATTSIDEGPLKQRCVVKRRTPDVWETVWDSVIVPRIDDAVLFTFVRNPWDRVCSAFFQCRDKARTPEYKIDPKWKFTNFVKLVLDVDWPNVNMHFAPQYDSFCYNDEPIEKMFVGRFERLAKDWAVVADTIGVSPTLPHFNAGGKSYVWQYDDESMEIVGRLYAPEIAALGYEFGK